MKRRLAIGLVVVAATAMVCVWYYAKRARENREAAVSAASQEVRGAFAAGVAAEWDARIGAVVGHAKSLLALGLSSAEAREAEFPRLAFERAVDGADWTQATALLPLWNPSDESAPDTSLLIRYETGMEDFPAARQRAWEAVRLHESDRQGLLSLWYRTFEADQEFLAPTVHRIGSDDGVERIRTFDVATSVMFRLYRDGEVVGLLKPQQTNPWTSYRGEIAAYRLCSLIHCDVSIPHNREARILDEDLARLMGLESVAALDNIERNDYRPVWFTDDQGQRWLYGTLKAWVPGFVYFPIEELDSWRYLSSSSMSLRRLERLSIEEALSGLAASHPEWFPRFLARAQRVTTAEFVHSLSDMHILDVLINNWDRYSSRDPASNCQWDDGQFVSIDNGASFHTPEEWVGHEVQLRMRRIRMFSRSTVEAIRWMNTEQLFHILFPPNPFIDHEEARWEAFLERRTWLLDYIDGVINDQGEQSTLVFP